MIGEYLVWYAKRMEDDYYLPENFLKGEESDIELKKAATWKEIIDLCYRPSEGIFWFTKFILGDLTYAGYPEKIHFNGLWWKWSRLSKEGDHIAIKCPRQHGKSTYWTVIHSIYRTSLFEHYNILISSASEDQAIALMGYIDRIIGNNEFLLSKKSASAKWSTVEIHYNGGKIVAKGVGSEVRGGTYDYIICDDILRSDNKLSDEDIEHYIDEELEPMIFVRRGQIVIVGTPKSDTDIFSSLEERVRQGSAWKLYTYSAILDWDRKVILCPDRFTWDRLMNVRKNIGQQKFDKEFMCQTYSSGSQLFPAEIRKKAKELGLNWKLYSKARPEESNHWYYYMSVDSARAGSASGDYTVVFVVAYNPDTQVKRIVWVWRKKGLKISEQVEQIATISKNFNNPIILVEKNNIGQDLIDQLIDNYNLSVEAFQTSSRSKEDLIRSLIVAFENEKIIIPQGDEFTREMMDELDRELDRFIVEVTRAGNEIMKGSGHSHDDMVMSLALANRCTQSFGYTPFAVSSGDRKTTSLERFAVSGDIREVTKF